MRNFIFILLFALCSFILTAQTTSGSTNNGTKDNYALHIVVKGETLYSIARQYNASVDEIKEMNEMSDNGINTGQTLKVPLRSKSVESVPVKTEPKVMETKISDKPVKQPASAGKHLEHKVIKGETLYSISKKYEGVSVDDIIQLNDLKDASISVGQVLKIKAEATFYPPQDDPYKGLEVKKEKAEADPLIEKTKVSYDDIVKTGETEKPGELTEEDKAATESMPGGDKPVSINYDNIKQSPKSSNDTLMAQNVDDIGGGKGGNVGDKTFKSLFNYMVGKGVKLHKNKGVATYLKDEDEKASFYAMYNGAKPGTVIRVRNLMNNRTVYLKVLGELPETGLDKDIYLKISGVAAEKLDVRDAKFLAEVTSYEK